MKKQVHIVNKATEICEKLWKEGFNGVRFDEARVEKEVVEDYNGELTKKQFIERQKHYCCFIAQPDLRAPDIDSHYVEAFVDANKFLEDFKAYLKKEFGPGVTINYFDGCSEYEVYRKSGKYCYDHFKMHPAGWH